MFPEKLPDKLMYYIELSPSGVSALDVLDSLKLCDSNTLKTTLSRLTKKGKIIRLTRGVYSVNPIKDPFICAEVTFGGYLGFSTALYLHKLITEVPYTLFVVTRNNSGSKQIGQYTFKGVSLKEKALGMEHKNYWISTRTKTLFDCLYLPQYSIEKEKLFSAYKNAKLSEKEWDEFNGYVKKFASEKIVKRIKEAIKKIKGK